VTDVLPPPLLGSEATWALFIDVDGTLLELARRPDLVIVPPRLFPLMDRAREKLGGAVALVSGRSLATLDDLFKCVQANAAGCHGAELRIGGRLQGNQWPDLLAIAPRLDDLLAVIPTAYVERKARSIAFHYDPSDIDSVRALRMVGSAIAHHSKKFRVLEGKNVVEVLPQDCGKGHAIATFMHHPPFRGRTPVFLGDDRTDEEGFIEVNGRGGLSICVGLPRATAARYRLASVSAVLDWLERSLA